MSETNEELHEETHEVVTVTEGGNEIAKAMSGISESFKKKNPVVNLAAEYLTLEIGETKHLMYLQSYTTDDVDKETGSNRSCSQEEEHSWL